MFEPFTQLDSSLARRFQGAGLGLYVSRALVDRRMAASWFCGATPAKGTTAEIRLPADRLITSGQ